MRKKIIVNHIMSADIFSHIFDAILDYFQTFSGADFQYIVSIHPQKEADIYHYHRPQMELQGLSEKSVVTVHFDLESYDSATEYAVFAKQYAEAGKIVCLNTLQQDFLHNRSLLNTIVIPHGYNEFVFTPKSNIKKTDGLLRLGVFSKRYINNFKGDDYIMGLFRRLPKEKFKFLFVGENRYLSQKDADFYGFASDFYEYVPYHLYNDMYHSIDALLVPSYWEGGPANLPEAAATMTPILSRRIAMAPDAIKEGINGYFIGDDIERDCELLVRLADNGHGIWDVLADNIAQHKGYFPTWRGVVKRYEEEVYAPLVVKKRDSIYSEHKGKL